MLKKEELLQHACVEWRRVNGKGEKLHLICTIVAPPSMAALTASVMERPHFLFIPESVTAYKKRSLRVKGCSLPEMFLFSLNMWSKGP